MSRLEPILSFVREAFRQKGHSSTVVLAIDGPCGSGKSTLAQELQRCAGATVVPLDDFFLPPEKRTKERLERPGENVDHERFLKEVLLPIRRKEREISYAPYDCRRNEMGPLKRIRASGLLVVEGSYALRPDFRPFYDVMVFLDISKEEQRKRLLAREGRRFEMFENRWIPLEERYFRAMNPREHATIVLKYEKEGS